VAASGDEQGAQRMARRLAAEGEADLKRLNGFRSPMYAAFFGL